LIPICNQAWYLAIFFTLLYLRLHDLTHPRGTLVHSPGAAGVPSTINLSQTQPELYGAQGELESMTCVKTNKDENAHGQSTTMLLTHPIDWSHCYPSGTLRSFNSRFEYASTDLVHTELWWQCYPGGTIVWTRTSLKVLEWALGKSKMISTAHRV
jgi:hypothetical protein